MNSSNELLFRKHESFMLNYENKSHNIDYKKVLRAINDLNGLNSVLSIQKFLTVYFCFRLFHLMVGSMIKGFICGRGSLIGYFHSWVFCKIYLRIYTREEKNEINKIKIRFKIENRRYIRHC